MRVQNKILCSLSENKADDFYYICNDAEQALLRVRSACPNEQGKSAIDKMLLDLNSIRMENYNALKEYTIVEGTQEEEYWDATEIARDGFLSLKKFNFGTDNRGNNYIITVDNNDIKRFNANSDEEAKKEYSDYKKKIKGKINYR